MTAKISMKNFSYQQYLYQLLVSLPLPSLLLILLSRQDDYENRYDAAIDGTRSCLKISSPVVSPDASARPSGFSKNWTCSSCSCC